MAKKEDLFGKLNIKNYNNQLEEVLEKKDFSSSTKNFLLSMLYKIETAYNDYSTVKNLNKTKGEFIEEIINTIKNNCEKIKLVKPLDKEYGKFADKREKCIVNKKEKSIISLYNEQYLLYAISQLNYTRYNFKNNLISESINELLNNGKNINNKEVIRDFDGWSWHIETKLIEDIECNLVFQNILMLIGIEFKTENELIKDLEKIYKKEDAKKVCILIYQISLLMYVKNNHAKKREYEIENLKIQEELSEMSNKIEYLKNITSQRKNLELRIKTIDKCLTDVSFLKREYIRTNEALKDDKKIFSISDFSDCIQNEKRLLMNELQKYNIKMSPTNYIKKKEKLKENLEILKVLDSKNDIYYYILELQKQFIEGLKEKIKQINTKKDVMEIIYKLRYYLNLPYKDKKIKDVDEINNNIYKVEENLYCIAYKMNILNQISVNAKVNSEITREILDTNIIELENIEVLFSVKDYQIILKIFDEENIEKTIKYDTIEGLTARMNKKFRLFIK